MSLRYFSKAALYAIVPGSLFLSSCGYESGQQSDQSRQQSGLESRLSWDAHGDYTPSKEVEDLLKRIEECRAVIEERMKEAELKPVKDNALGKLLEIRDIIRVGDEKSGAVDSNRYRFEVGYYHKANKATASLEEVLRAYQHPSISQVLAQVRDVHGELHSRLVYAYSFGVYDERFNIEEGSGSYSTKISALQSLERIGHAKAERSLSYDPELCKMCKDRITQLIQPRIRSVMAEAYANHDSD